MDRTPPRHWDFPSAVFLILILLTTSLRLYVTHWALGMGTAIVLALSGAVLGLALGSSIFKPMTVFWFTFDYSIPIFILVLGAFLYDGTSWLDRIADLSNRLVHAFGLLINNQPVQDTVLFVVFMALLFWIVGLTAGYAMTRFGNFIGAVVPAGVVMVIIQLYDSSNRRSDTFLAALFFLCLLLLGRLTFVNKRLFWKEQHVAIFAESRTNLNVTFTVLALATVLLVWMAPTSAKSFSHVKTAWDNLIQPLRNAQKNLGHAVAGLQASGKVRTVVNFGNTLPLGRQAATGETVYFRVQTPRVKSISRYYWRVRSYNVFLNDHWYSENVSSTPFSPDQPHNELPNPEIVMSRFTFTALSVDLASLVTPAHPVWVSHPSELFFLQGSPGILDPVQFLSDPPVLAGRQYSVLVNEYEPTLLQLRNAGENYPGWVASRYMQLPNDLSPEIVALANRIIAGSGTPYDKAAAITKYLRSNIKYSINVEAPPAGQDSLNWFLFDSKTGFCNYYATAEVILLRSAGIPARMVVGFAQGEFETPDYYSVRQRDTHAWPEAYFPGVGWVEFEPTTNQQPLERPLGEIPASSGQTGAKTPPGLARTEQETPLPADGNRAGLGSDRSVNLLVRLILICTIIVTILRMYTFGTLDNILKANRRVFQKPLPILVNQFFEKRLMTPPGWLSRWAILSELNPIERSFMTVYRSLRWLGKRPSPAQTPAEAAIVLSGLLPDVSKEIYSLLDEYQHHLYSHIHGYMLLARRAAKVIQQETIRVAIQQRWRPFWSIFKPGSR